MLGCSSLYEFPLKGREGKKKKTMDKCLMNSSYPIPLIFQIEALHAGFPIPHAQLRSG